MIASRLLVIPLLLTATACGSEPPRWNVRDHIPLEKFTIQSHRGAGVFLPENSMQAFNIAWRLMTVPEADLRTSKDGVVVAFHDKDLRRVLPDAPAALQDRGMQDLNYEEIAKLDIGAWRGDEFAGQRVPRLSDVIETLRQNPDRRLYIDIKNVDFEQLAAETRDVHPQLILASTKYDEICRWKRLAPDSSTLHWMGGDEPTLAKRLESLRAKKYACVDQLQVHVHIDADGGLRPSAEFLTRVGAELRKHGVLFQTLPWESRDKAVYTRLLDLGVASFATDYPDIAVSAVRGYYLRNN